MHNTLAPAPGSAAVVDPLLQQELSKVYRRYNPSQKCWFTASDGDRFCMSLQNTATRAASNGSTITLFTFAGDNLTNDSHAGSGRLGLFVEKTDGGQAVFYAVNPVFPAGSWGKAPPKADIEIAEIAPDLWGWVIKEEEMHQGYQEGIYQVVPAEAHAQTLAVFPSVYDDCGAKPDACSSMNFKLSFDKNRAADKFYPVIVGLSGEQNGKAMRPERFTLSWNNDARRYGPVKYTVDVGAADYVKALRSSKR